MGFDIGIAFAFQNRVPGFRRAFCATEGHFQLRKVVYVSEVGSCFRIVVSAICHRTVGLVKPFFNRILYRRPSLDLSFMTIGLVKPFF